ncbi:hypothetical protein ACA910_021523 [Epithemia clementina (nom. ined.)]
MTASLTTRRTKNSATAAAATPAAALTGPKEEEEEEESSIDEVEENDSLSSSKRNRDSAAQHDIHFTWEDAPTSEMATTTTRNSYLEMVAAKRARNEAMIQQLGIPQFLKKRKSTTRTPSSSLSSSSSGSPENKSKRSKTKKAPKPVRQSLRIRKAPAEFSRLALFPDDPGSRRRRLRPRRAASLSSPSTPSLMKKGVSKSASPRNAPSKFQHDMINKRRLVTAPSPTGVMDFDDDDNNNNNSYQSDEESWLETLEYYLKEVDCISASNVSRVMSQVRKLATGQGVAYGRWPEHAVFGCGTPVHPNATDFEALYDRAVEHEATYGRDLGNGWLLLHPIHKLCLFQSWWRQEHQQQQRQQEQSPRPPSSPKRKKQKA